MDCRVVPTCEAHIEGVWKALCGALGMGLLPEHRGRGIGPELITRAIADAWARRFLRIELGVRESNRAAIALYERVGFVVEGRRRRAASREDGDYEDTLVMGLLNERLMPDRPDD